jgi:hypothetical protein
VLAQVDPERDTRVSDYPSMQNARDIKAGRRGEKNPRSDDDDVN